MKQKTKEQKTMEQAIEKINSLGFDVYYEPGKSYGHFTDGENIGYIQQASLAEEGVVDISSENKPSLEHGTGQRIKSRVFVSDITIEDLQLTMKASKNGVPEKYVYKTVEEWEKAANNPNTELFSATKENSITSSSEMGNDKMEKLKEELKRTIERTLDFNGNTREACEDVFADHNMSFDEKLYDEANYEVSSTYGMAP